MLLITGIMAEFVVSVVLQPSKYNVCHFYDDCDTSGSHSITTPNGFLVDGGMCFSGAITVVCLVFLMGLIEFTHDIGLR